MPQGIIFGDYLLPKTQFIKIFQEWYQQKYYNLKIELKQLSNEIFVYLLGQKIGKRQVIDSTLFNQKVIYEKIEEFMKNYFGNSQISILGAVKTNNGNYSWGFSEKESSLMGKAGFTLSSSTLENMQSLEQILKAQTLEQILNAHLGQLFKSLDTYKLNKEEAKLLHINRHYKQSTRDYYIQHYTNKTYNDTIFYKQQEGKKIDAFLSHIGQYHQELFSAITSSNLDNIEYKEDDFIADFFKKDANMTQKWLLDSLNTTSWFKKGDILIVGKDGKILYNIQLKTTTQKSKTFDISFVDIYNLFISMIDNIDSPQRLAELIYSKLFVETSNEIEKSYIFLTEAALNEVRQNLNLS